MDKTVRLFDKDSYISEFDGIVLSCTPDGDSYLTVLDKTAFFPEEGGQSSDGGTIGGVGVKHVFEADGVIYHRTDAPLEAGDTVHCALDFKERYRKMQSHTGEHILCGTAHRLWGAENVGFHLSEEYVRVDLDVYLDREKVAYLEKAANDAIAGNHAIVAWYPTAEEIEKIDYRSKSGIEGDVRLVKIEDVDVCACCAPHVRSTSEVGLLKVVDSIKYKGGTRLEIVCGPDSVDLFMREHAELSAIAESFSVKREDAMPAIDRLRAELAGVEYKLKRAERTLMERELEALGENGGAKCFFFAEADDENLRFLLNGAAGKVGVAAGFIGCDRDGYRYIIRSDKVDLRAEAKKINGAIDGRGGGSPVMITGKCSASRERIEKFFAE